MPDPADADVVRLTLPGDADLRPVLEVAVVVVVRRQGWPDAAITDARRAAGEAFEDAVDRASGGAVGTEIEVVEGHLVVRLVVEDDERTVTIPEPSRPTG